VFEADTARRGLTEAGTRKPDLLVLDLGLPDGDGLEVIRDVRGWSAVPIVVLSARADEADKIAALDAGADDYLTKPFGVGELLARVRANLRRPRGQGPTARPTSRCSALARWRWIAVLTHRQLPRSWGPRTRTKTLCASTWAICARSSKPTRRSPNTC
jgi:DNA-binding response OmpR family regulator